MLLQLDEFIVREGVVQRRKSRLSRLPARVLAFLQLFCDAKGRRFISPLMRIAADPTALTARLPAGITARCLIHFK